MSDEQKQNIQPESEPEEKNELDQANQKAEEYLNNWKRTQADLLNYKKEEANRIKDLIQFGNEGLLLEVIDRLDNLERVLKHVPPNISEQNGDWLKGIEQSIKSFQELLKKYGVERIATQNVAFDPLLHEAVQMEPGGDHQVVEEYQSGYTMYGKVIRPARVKVK